MAANSDFGATTKLQFPGGFGANTEKRTFGPFAGATCQSGGQLIR